MTESEAIINKEIEKLEFDYYESELKRVDLVNNGDVSRSNETQRLNEEKSKFIRVLKRLKDISENSTTNVKKEFSRVEDHKFILDQALGFCDLKVKNLNHKLLTTQDEEEYGLLAYFCISIHSVSSLITDYLKATKDE